MNDVQHQITSLNRKVDQLHDIVERMSHQVTILITDKQPSFQERQSFRGESAPLMISDSSNSASFSLGIMEHKDILQDDAHKNNVASGGSDASWSSEIQIRRLTAQLTAAYNRIAALEEQLLSYRINS